MTPEQIYEAARERILRAHGPGSVQHFELCAALWDRWTAEAAAAGDLREAFCRSHAAKLRGYADRARRAFRARAAGWLRR